MQTGGEGEGASILQGKIADFQKVLLKKVTKMLERR